MPQTYSIILFFLALLTGNLQERQPANVCRLETKYDRFTDTTTVQCELIVLGATPARLSVQANAAFRGKEVNETVKFWLFLSSNRSGATRHTQPLFREAQTLCLWLDTVQLELPVKDYRHTYFELIRSFSESAHAEISHEDLRKLLAAESLAGKWGGAEFKFPDAVLASLKDFISRQVFAAHTR